MMFLRYYLLVIAINITTTLVVELERRSRSHRRAVYKIEKYISNIYENILLSIKIRFDQIKAIFPLFVIHLSICFSTYY